MTARSPPIGVSSTTRLPPNCGVSRGPARPALSYFRVRQFLQIRYRGSAAERHETPHETGHKTGHKTRHETGLS